MTAAPAPAAAAQELPPRSIDIDGAAKQPPPPAAAAAAPDVLPPQPAAEAEAAAPFEGTDEEQAAAVKLQALQRGRIARAEVAKLRAEGAAAELVEVGATVRVDSPLTHS